MALPADYITGTITLTNGSVDFTGTDTGWLAADFREGDTIPYVAGGESFAPPIIQSITSNTAGTLTTPWAGPTLTGVAYRMRYQWDSGRVSAQTRTMIEQLGNGNLQSISALTGPGVLVFDGPHSTVVRPETDFINGVAYDVQVDTLADRAAYDGQAAGFSVLVSNVGDGRSALYSKNTNTGGDWSDAAYITGPVGPIVTIEAGTTTTLPPGSDATFDVTPVTGGYELNVGIPAGEGFYNAGVYSAANAYNKDDVVRHNRSSFIALQSVPAGENPSNVFPPVDTAFWQALVIAGQDGTGTGDVVGPTIAVDGQVALFDGTTGKIIRAGTSIRKRLSANLNLYVRPDGNDANTGMSNTAGGAFLTPERAATVAWTEYDFAGYSIFINVADGTYTSYFSLSGIPPWSATSGADAPVTFIGNATTPANCVINGGISAISGARFRITGFTMQSSVAGQSCLSARNDGSHIFPYGNMRYGAVTSNADHLGCTDGGSFTETGTVTVFGGAMNHYHVTEGCHARTSAAVTLTGTPNFSGQFAGVASSNFTTIGASFTGAATGRRALVHLNGVVRHALNTNPSFYFPGSIAPIMQTGGIIEEGSEFFAHRNFVDQTFAASTSWVLLDLTTLRFNRGAQFGVSPQSSYFPTNGTIELHASATITGTPEGGQLFGIAIFKNGASLKEVWAGQQNVTPQTISITLQDRAENTSGDGYQVYVQVRGTGTKTISGSPVWTNFQGRVIV